jgi:hypothetical protein
VTFAAPGFLLGGLLAALATLALHFLTREEPRRYLFPTARFVPESREQAPSRSRRLRDRLVLAVRLSAITSIALAFARPSLTVAKAALTQVIATDSGGLSAGLIRAIREAHRLRDRADSVAIVLVAPLTRSSFDSATLAIRSQWPGGLTWHPVLLTPDSASPPFPLTLRAASDDPLRATLSLAGLGATPGAEVRLVREAALIAEDSTWARAQNHVLVHWPAERAGRDTIGAVVTSRTVLVAPFVRPETTLIGLPIAWWVDGRVAAAETAIGSGCIRDVAIPVDPVGDLALRERLRDLVGDLLSPCGGPRDLTLADSSTRAALLGTAAPAVATSSLPALVDAGRKLPPWLLGAGLLLLVAEQVLRRRKVA